MLRTELTRLVTSLIAFGVFGIAATSNASAADLAGSLKDDFEERPYIATDWTGFYGGIHGGVGAFTGMAIDWSPFIFGRAELYGDVDTNGFAALAGVQAGYNRQVGNVIYGLEGDIAWTGSDEDRFFDLNEGAYIKAEMGWLATIRGRLGLAVGNATTYVTAGLAMADVEHCADDNAGQSSRCLPPINEEDIDHTSTDGVKLGFVAGAGVEAALGRGWSLKGEYLFVQMDKDTIRFVTSYNPPGEMDFSHRSHLLRVGLNYHLNGLEGHGDSIGPGPWTGVYGGVHGGIGAFSGMGLDWGEDAWFNPDGDFDLNAFAGLGGVQLGYNWQSGNIVFGIEGDFAWTSFDEREDFAGLGEPIDQYVVAEMDWLSTMRGRLGVAAGNAMAYVIGGLAIAHLDHCANNTEDGGTPCSTDGDKNIAWSGVKLGLVAGAGVEAALGRGWSLKGEYLYVQMDKENVVYDNSTEDDDRSIDDIDFSNRSHLLRVGLNYHMHGLPVAAQTGELGPWTGFYGGIHGGFGAFTGLNLDWGDNIWTDAAPDGDFDLNAFAGLFGVQLGYNHQHGNVVYGLEGDVAWTGFDEEQFGGALGEPTSYVKSEMEWLTTIRGRLGLATGNAMAYVTGGLAIAQLHHCANRLREGDGDGTPCETDGDDDIAWDGVKLGLVAGAGVEAALGGNWSLKGEYLFVQMDTQNVVYDNVPIDDAANEGPASDGIGDIDFSNRSHLFRIGLSYKFDSWFARPGHEGYLK